MVKFNVVRVESWHSVMTDDTLLGSRRTFLRRTAAVGALGTAASGTAAGRRATRAETLPADRVESLLDQHASDVLAELEDVGVLADRGDLPTGVGSDFAGVADGNEGAALVATDGRPAELRVTTRADAGTLTVAVRPADGHAYALFDTGDDRVTYDVESGWGTFGVGTDTTCSCIDEPCTEHDVGYYEECCTSTSCSYECKCY
jgi:hypothetical protein